MKCAFYEREITPPLGCSIPGYFNVRLGEDVLDRLYAKSVVFQNNTETYILVVIDGCGVEPPLYKKIVERIETFTGIKKENITVSAVHTHTGLPKFFENFDDVAPEARQAETGFLEVVSKLIADCAILAFKRLEESELYYAKGAEKTITRCRDYIMKDGSVRTNPPAFDPDIVGPMHEADYDLPVLLVCDKNQNPKGAVITYSCHLDCIGGEKYSGDYSSIIAKELKKHYGEDFVTVFMMSAGGDMNNYYIDRVDLPEDHYVTLGKILAAEVLRSVANADKIESDDLKVSYKEITVARREIPKEKLEHAKHIIKTVKPLEGVKIAADNTDQAQFELAMAKELMNVLKIPEEIDLPLQVIKIGDFAFYALPSENYAGIALEIKRKSPTDKTMVGTLCNANYEYIPTRDCFEFEDIYPAKIGGNMLCIDTAEMITENICNMAEKLFL